MTVKLSVIVPSYNRPDSLKRALESLALQTINPATYEVVVVDDGSTYKTSQVAEAAYPFRFRFEPIENAGATNARKRGVAQSVGKILVFMDDDITLTPPALEALTGDYLRQGVVGLGNLVDRVPEMKTGFARRVAKQSAAGFRQNENHEVDFGACNTQLLAIYRSDYEGLGGLQDPTGGWPNWDDVDFGFRAHRAGLRLIKCAGARAFHWDQSLTTMRQSYRRWYQASHAAARLFEKYPGIWQHLPMFEDKLRINWKADSPGLIVRKLIRPLSSTIFILRVLEHLSYFLEKLSLPYKTMAALDRWVIGGYIYRGLRDGQHQLNLR